MGGMENENDEEKTQSECLICEITPFFLYESKASGVKKDFFFCAIFRFPFLPLSLSLFHWSPVTIHPKILSFFLVAWTFPKKEKKIFTVNIHFHFLYLIFFPMFLISFSLFLFPTFRLRFNVSFVSLCFICCCFLFRASIHSF